MRILKRKGLALNDLVTVGLMFVLIATTLAIGAYINVQMTAAMGQNTPGGGYANATLANATLGMVNISAWLPIIGIVVAAGVIIGVLVRSFGIGGKSEGV